MRSIIFFLLRWLLAIAVGYFCVRQMIVGLKVEGLGAAGPLILSFGALIAAILLVAPDTIGRVCGFFGDAFVNVVIPGAHFNKPPLSYLLARRYRHELRIGEAIAEYRKIIYYYPKERDAYLELIEMTHQIGAQKIADRYARRFRRRFKEQVIFLAKSASGSEEGK